MNLIAVVKQGKLIERSKGEGYLTTIKSCGISLVESKLMLKGQLARYCRIPAGEGTKRFPSRGRI